MGDFKRGGQNFGGGGGGRRGSGGGGGGRSGGRPDMHKAVCSDCGKDCEVPFRPTGDKPVFCSDCFAKQGGGDSRDRGPKKFGDRNSKSKFNNKPSYQNNANTNTENYKAQFEQLSSKLDQVLELVATLVPKKMKEIAPSDKKTTIKPKTKKVVKKKTTKKK